MTKLITLLYIFLASITLTVSAQTIDIDKIKIDCVICPQFVPDCKVDEKLILQSCKECAHCESINSPTTSDCQKCTFHFQCPSGNICKDGCCTSSAAKEKVKGKEEKICKNTCGLKCCKTNEKCITIDQCKGKPSCALPLLQYCSAKKPEPLRGRL